MARMFPGNRLLAALLSVLLISLDFPSSPVFSQEKSRPASPSATSLLTLDQIYSEPSLSGRLAHHVAWVPDNKKLSYFEESGTGKDRHTSLWVLDVTSGNRSILVPTEKFEQVLPATTGNDASKIARAPAQYFWAPNSEALLFSDSHSLVWYDLKSGKARVLVTGKDEIADPKISPDGRFVSFLRDHNIFFVDTSLGKIRTLTVGGTEGIRKGEVDWVYREELHLSTAYWWSPDSSAIAYLEMDERQVSQFPLVNFESFIGEATLQRYPVGGGKNPIVHVYVANISGGHPQLLDTGRNSDIYIPRVNWSPDSRRVAIERLNRQQTSLDVLLASALDGRSSVLFTETDPYWINVSDDLRFLKDGKRFLWSSERSGYRHLYLYDLTGKQIAQLTSGDWEVTGVTELDEGRGLVYFTSTQKSPLGRHLFSVSLNGSGMQRLSTADGVHRVQFSPNAKFYLDTYSNVSTPPRQDIHRADGSRLTILTENKISELENLRLSPVEFFTVQTHDNVALNCYMIKPPDFDPSKRYPVITEVYGGPGVQIVLNEWGDEDFLWHQLMAQKGFIIFGMDNRGSAGRGHLFEEPIHYRFGAQELSDQRDGAAWLRHQPYVDANRIGIWGWSYGGHMTLHAMFEAPEIYKVGFSVAPVTDWHFYDSIYTERYIGLPDSVHEESYQESSPIKNASGLKGYLLIAHGSSDDNVHYSNTLALVDELIKAGRYVEVMTFPGRGHDIPDLPARRALFSRATQFFLEHL